MIYLDAAATSLQKPASVRYAVMDAMERLSSPGRGGYRSAMDAAEVLYEARQTAAALFHAKEPERVTFTSSATHGLNTAIKSLVKPGDRVVISGYEHNAVLRPLHALGAAIDVAASPLFDAEAAVEAFRKKLPGAGAAVCNHVSNVFGYILPLDRIAALCREYGVPLIVDASQSAGSVELRFDDLGCAFMAMPGHKGLLGPQGTGILICADENIRPLMEGGTGSESESRSMPPFLPDRLEAGTHNMPGIAGLLAGMRWIMKRPAGSILRHEARLRRVLSEALAGEGRIRVFESETGADQTGVLSVQLAGLDCEEAARLLSERGIAVRAGLHCAPLAHETAGTLREGAVRLSLSPFSTEPEAERAAAELMSLV